MDPDLNTYEFWKKISEIEDLRNKQRYQELAKVVFACLSISHANADPERGFSHNKSILEHRETLVEDTISAIRMVKDAILQYGSVEEFPNTRRLLDLCAASRKKYFLHLEIEKERQLKLAKEKEKSQEALAASEKKIKFRKDY